MGTPNTAVLLSGQFSLGTLPLGREILHGRCLQENVEIVRQGYAGFAENGVEGDDRRSFTEDAVIYSIPEWPDDPDVLRASTASRKLTRRLDGRDFDDCGLRSFAKSMTEGRHRGRPR